MKKLSKKDTEKVLLTERAPRKRISKFEPIVAQILKLDVGESLRLTKEEVEKYAGEKNVLKHGAGGFFSTRLNNTKSVLQLRGYHVICRTLFDNGVIMKRTK